MQNAERRRVRRTAGLQTVPLALYRVFQLALTIVPLALFAGIFRYRLFSVDTLVTRTLVYGALAGFVSAVYIGVVVGVGGVLGAGHERQPSAVGRGDVHRRRRVRAGEGPDGATGEPHRLRPSRHAVRSAIRVLRTRRATRSPAKNCSPAWRGCSAKVPAPTRADVWLASRQRAAPDRDVARPDAHAEMAPLPITGPEIPWIDGVANAVAVRHQGELFGALSVVKAGNDALTPTEEKLMADLGRQAGLVLRNMRLTAELRARLEELRASRQRIVAAGDEERRRLERNLHDGAQQELVAIKVQLSLAEDMADELEGDNEPLLELARPSSRTQTGDAVESLRDLARGIYPPLLAAEGLPAALNAQARKSPSDIEVDADVGRYSQDIEAAIYFCCLEAFQNAAKYAGDCHVIATLRETEGVLAFEVGDTGCGFEGRRQGRHGHAQHGRPRRVARRAVGSRGHRPAGPAGTCRHCPSTGTWDARSQDGRSATSSTAVVARRASVTTRLMGDCHTVASIGRDASIDWWCPQRFDTPSVFARILDPDAGSLLDSYRRTAGVESAATCRTRTCSRPCCHERRW